MRVNAIHAALLRTGKVLIVAGSGNDRKQFNAGTFKTLLWDPDTDKFKLIHTPSDMFCAGHVFLPDGKLLIAGGTRRYEKLEAGRHARGGRDDGQERVARRPPVTACRRAREFAVARRDRLPQHQGSRRQAGREDASPRTGPRR